MENLHHLKTRPETNRDVYDPAAGMRISPPILETVCQKMIDVMVARTGIPPDKPGHQITAAERRRLRELLHDFRLTVVGHRPLDEVIVTAGGVDTDEVNPKTMASRLVRGLHFAGEVLDVQADTGGYNLQAAFSTGYVAGRAAAQFVNEP